MNMLYPQSTKIQKREFHKINFGALILVNPKY